MLFLGTSTRAPLRPSAESDHSDTVEMELDLFWQRFSEASVGEFLGEKIFVAFVYSQIAAIAIPAQMINLESIAVNPSRSLD